MAGNLKGDIINAAYSRARISGLTIQPAPEDLELALDLLEDMAAQWSKVNICTGYAFEDFPDPSTPHNIDRAYQSAYKANLAMLLLTHFGKVPLPTLALEAAGTLSALYGATAQVKQIVPSIRQPRGAGNTLRHNRRQQFYRPQVSAPTSCDTIKMVIGDADNFIESFSSYLKLGEDITGYTLEVDLGLVIVSQSLSTPEVSYQVRIDSADSQVLQVKIIATTSFGRIETRIIDFEVINA